MSLGCKLAGHSVGEDQIYNSGYFFTECRRCGQPLFRGARSGWAPAPTGHRIVWKAGWQNHSVTPDYAGLLPIAEQPAASLPAVLNPFFSSSRSMTRLAAGFRGRAGTTAAAVEMDLEDFGYPRLLFAVVIIGAGLKMLVDFATGR